MANQECHSVVLDKIDLMQALDFGEDLLKLTYTPTYRCVFTSTDQRKDSAKDKAELEEFQAIKKHFMGQDKALIIKLSHDVNQSQGLFERINHLYVMCE